VSACSNTLDPLLARLALDYIDEDDLSVRLKQLFEVVLRFHGSLNVYAISLTGPPVLLAPLH
jgi:hypothetical protein